MRELLVYWLLGLTLLFTSCENRSKEEVPFKFIDLSILVGWTGERGSIRIDSIGNVNAKTQWTQDMNVENTHYFEYKMEPDALDTLSQKMAGINFLNIEKTEGDDCNRCLIYDLVITTREGNKIHLSYHDEYRRGQSENVAKLNELALYICRRWITDEYLKRSKNSYESNIDWAYGLSPTK